MCTFYTLVNVYFLHIVQEDGRGAGREQVTRGQDRREEDGEDGCKCTAGHCREQGAGGQGGNAKKTGRGNVNDTPTPCFRSTFLRGVTAAKRHRTPTLLI